MKMDQVSDNCFAVINEKSRVCDANSGLINIGGGMVVDTQSDLSHARQMIELFSRVWPAMPERVVNTHEDSDHVFGNQLFKGAEIIGHRSVPERMKEVAEPAEIQKLMRVANGTLTGPLMKLIHPGVVAIARQLKEDYDFSGVELVPPTTLLDDRLVVNLGDIEVHLIYVGPCHQLGDTIVWVPKERVLFAGDVIFRLCTPMGWVGTFEKWCKTLDFIAIELKPEIIVPGHGPVCGVEGATEMKAYLQYVREESRQCFDDGLSARNASRKLDFSPYSDWLSPERIYLNVERAYREFRGEPPDKPWEQAKTFDVVYGLAKERGLAPVF
jgi:glyoxylase-like metal-dependent hydrolase (beta-lactamase superfamily II)